MDNSIDLSPEARAAVHQEAAQAAQVYSDINDACRYPWRSLEGRAFKAEFTRLRLQMFADSQAAAKVGQKGKATTP